MHLFYNLPNIQLRLDIFLGRQRAALLPLSYEDAKLYDASFQNVQEHLILLHVVPHRNHEITSARFLKTICPRIVPKDGIIFGDHRIFVALLWLSSSYNKRDKKYPEYRHNVLSFIDLDIHRTIFYK